MQLFVMATLLSDDFQTFLAPKWYFWSDIFSWTLKKTFNIKFNLPAFCFIFHIKCVYSSKENKICIYKRNHSVNWTEENIYYLKFIPTKWKKKCYDKTNEALEKQLSSPKGSAEHNLGTAALEYMSFILSAFDEFD